MLRPLIEPYEEYMDLKVERDHTSTLLRHMSHEAYDLSWCRQDGRYAVWAWEHDDGWVASSIHVAGKEIRAHMRPAPLPQFARTLHTWLMCWASDPLV